MLIQCPGCLSKLMVVKEDFQSKVLLKCPECLYIFLVEEDQEIDEQSLGEQSETPGEATLLVSDIQPEEASQSFHWNVPEASLTIMQGRDQGTHFRITQDKLSIGREKADLIIPDPAVSRKHAEIERKQDWYLIRDLNSKNGTLVNDEPVDEAKLRNLDEIKIGETSLLYSTMAAQSNLDEPDASGERDAILGPEKTDIDSDAAEKALPLPPKRRLFLEVMQGSGKGKSLELKSGRAILGRVDDSDIKIEDDQVSRKHLQIEAFSREQIFITDLASQNGTYLNGIRIRTTKLKHEDLIRMGNTVLKFVTVDTPGED